MHVPTLSMSNIVSNDNLLSPVSDWDHSHFAAPTLDALSFSNFSLPSPPLSMSSSRMHSPMPTSKMLKSRLSPDGSESEQQLCISTHQVFDVPAPVQSPSAEPEELPRHSPAPSSECSSVVPAKRPSTSAPAPAKKARSVAERVTTKDFVPPDVTGLSKREARLVKNRAAAFLSRQRKREEFENMEVRVTELEQENARLLALATGGHSQDDNNDPLLSEVELLKRQLAASKERERELSAELSRKSITPSQPVKMETCESDVELPSRSGTPQPPNKSGASLGLMVLLCALPTLLSLPTHSALPSTFSLPLSGSASLPPSSTSFDMSSIISNDYDWAFNSGGSIMDLDVDNEGRISGSSLQTSAAVASNSKKLEFVDVDSEALGLSGLDISFDAKASQDGKIRVRIHPPSASPSAATTAASSPAPISDSEDTLMYPGADISGTTTSTDSVTSHTDISTSDFDSLGPFLGVGGGNDLEFGAFSGMSVDSLDSLSSSTFDFGSFDEGFGSSTSSSSGRRRVRIALKSLPGQGREGGEWEVQVC